MATRVPRYDQQVRDQAVSGQKIADTSSVEAFGGGRALAGIDAAGRAAESIGKTVHDVAQEADLDRVKGAALQLEETTIDLHTNKETGYINRKGKDALTVTEEYGKRLKDKYDEISKGLGNDSQRAYFKQVYDKTNLDFKGKTELYAAGESRKYESDQKLAGLELMHNKAALYYGSEKDIDDAINKSLDLVSDYSRMNGIRESDPEYQLMAQKQTSRIRSSVAERQMDDPNFGPSKALQYVNTHKDDFTDSDFHRITTALESGVREEKATAIANQIYDKEGYTDIAAATERANKIGDEKLKSEVLSRIKNKVELENHRSKQEYDKTVVDLSNLVENGRKVSEIPSVWGKLGPKERAAFKLREDQLAGVAEVKPDITTYAKYDTMSVQELERKDFSELYLKARPNLTDAQWNKVRDKWEIARAAAKGDEKAKTRLATETEKDEQIFRAMQDFKIAGLSDDTLKGKMKENQKLTYQKFQFQLNDRLAAIEASGKKADLNMVRDEARKIVADNAKKVYVNDSWFGAPTPRPIADLKESDKEKVVVPFKQIQDADIRKAVNVLKANGQFKELSSDELVSVVKSEGSPIGKTLRQRMEKAYGTMLIGGGPQSFKKKLLGN
jgi:hypothetical protein